MSYQEIQLPDTYNMTTSLLDDQLSAGHGDRIAIHAAEASVSYSNLCHSTCQVARGVRAADLRPEDRVALLLGDRPEFHFVFLGAIRAGCQAVPFNTALTPEDYVYMLNDSRARVLVAEYGLVAPILERRGQLPYLQHVVTVGGSLPGTSELADWLDGDTTDFEPEPTPRDEGAFWLYSSGSTGMPKAAVHAHKDVIHSTEFFGRQALGVRAEDMIFSVPRLFFAYGLGNSLYIPLGLGASVALLSERPKPDRVLDIVDEFRPTVFFGVPTGYAQLLTYVESTEVECDWSSVRVCASGGEPLPEGLYRRWRERFGIEILDGLGSSEGAHIFISNVAGRVRPGSSGELVPGYEARIVKSDGELAAADEVGMLEVKGASFALRYWNKQQKTRETFQGTWNRTGDYYARDADGYYWFQGRADDMLKSGGVWVSPIEVENLLLECDEVSEVAVATVSDEDGLDKPVAFVVANSGAVPDHELASMLKQCVRSNAAPWKVPHRVVFIPELPKTASGKVQRFKLRQVESSPLPEKDGLQGAASTT